MSCVGNGMATIYINSIFMSNQVTPATIDDYVLDFDDVPGDSESTLPETTQEPETTTQPVTINAIDTPTWTERPETTGAIDSSHWTIWPEAGAEETSIPAGAHTEVINEPTTSCPIDHTEITHEPITSVPTDDITKTYEPTNTQPTTLLSTTQEPTTMSSEEPTPICTFTKGETCDLVCSSQYPQDALCAYTTFYTRDTYEASFDTFPIRKPESSVLLFADKTPAVNLLPGHRPRQSVFLPTMLFRVMIWRFFRTLVVMLSGVMIGAGRVQSVSESEPTTIAS